MLNIIINAYACSPSWGSEPGVGWNWIIHIAQHCNVFVITEGEWRKEIEKAVALLPQRDNIHFYYLPVSEKARKMCWNQGDWRFYYYYAKWQKRALQQAKTIIANNRIDVVHQLNMVGFREPGYLWKITNHPFVWGPIGGVHTFPIAYLSNASFKVKFFFHLKNSINILQLKYAPRVVKALQRANLLIGAVREVELKFPHREVITISETGVYGNQQGDFDKNRFIHETFDILWIGKFDFRKQLSIAIETMAQLKAYPYIRLHIYGSGNSEQVEAYHEQARALGLLNSCVIFHGNVHNEEIHQAMRRAQLFLFTSVSEETSTVVLEAINNRLPVLCFDTCGFGGVVDESIGEKVQLTTPKQSAIDFATHILRLSNDRSLLELKSAACELKYNELSWESKGKRMATLYVKAMDDFQNKKKR